MLEGHINALDRLVAPSRTRATPPYQPSLRSLAIALAGLASAGLFHIGCQLGRNRLVYAPLKRALELVAADIETALELRHEPAFVVLDVEGARAEADFYRARIRHVQDDRDGVPAAAGARGGRRAARRDEAARRAEAGRRGRAEGVRQEARGVHAHRRPSHARERDLLFVDDLSRPDAQGCDGGPPVAQGQHHAVLDDGLDEGFQGVPVDDVH